MTRHLEVRLHDQRVGHLVEVPDGSELRFAESYFDLVPRPVLGQKFEDDLSRVHRSRTGEGLPDFFANLTPEGKLRQVIEEASSIDTRDELSLLSFVGGDLPGAVVVLPEASEDWEGTTAPEPEVTAEEIPDQGLRFSLAGVQLKFSMLLTEEKLTLPGRDRAGDWIVKFPSPTFPKLPENELSMLDWAAATGFEVPERRLIEREALTGLPARYVLRDERLLMVRRFDRSSAGRIHQEDLAQAVGLPPRRKYDQITYEAIASLTRRLVDEDAVDEMIRRLVFVIASGNNDAHLKNWSLIYPDRIHPRWSPLYDQVATVAWQEPGRDLSLKLAGVKHFGEIDEGVFTRFAEKANVEGGRVQRLVATTLESLRDSWRQIHEDLPLPADHREALRDHWQRVPVLRRMGPLA